MDTYPDTSWWRTTETSLAVSFETYLRRRGDALMGLRHYVPLRCDHDIPIRRREDLPLGRLDDFLLWRRWVFHFRRTYNVTGMSKKKLLRRRQDVLLPGGILLSCFSNFNLLANGYKNLRKTLSQIYFELDTWFIWKVNFLYMG